MKAISVALTLIAVLASIPMARARLGDSEDQLTERFGPPKVVEKTTGDVPTEKGYYAELKESFNTNVNLIISRDTNYNAVSYGLDLVELRTRYDFETNNFRVVVYLGNPNEKYRGVDFTGKSAREVIYSPLVWSTTKAGDKLCHQQPFSQAIINFILDENKGDSTWDGGWQPFGSPGVYIKRTSDKARLAVAYGLSENDVFRVEVRMVDDDNQRTY